MRICYFWCFVVWIKSIQIILYPRQLKATWRAAETCLTGQGLGPLGRILSKEPTITKIVERSISDINDLFWYCAQGWVPYCLENSYLSLSKIELVRESKEELPAWESVTALTLHTKVHSSREVVLWGKGGSIDDAFLYITYLDYSQTRCLWLPEKLTFLQLSPWYNESPDIRTLGERILKAPPLPGCAP